MVTALPTGTVTFLFTDVEGSTRLWETDSDGMAKSLSIHDEIMRQAVEARRGHVFSTAGDAFAVAFHNSDDALAAALDIQLSLHGADWPGPQIKVRMGIHTGAAEERAGDYFGPVLNRAARIMSAGHGGQILLSSVAAEAVEPVAPVTIKDLGTHHLKDLDEPEHVFELRHDALPIVEKPIRTVDVRRHNLPDYLTSFVGRDVQIEDLTEALSESRLVALTGVGGTGKTRLATEVARRTIDSYPDGAWLIELAPVANPHFIMTTIGEVWGLRPGEGATIEDVVTRFLWSRELLLVVDNCEHLIDGAAAAIKLVLDSCPNVRVVATSRESLGIPGEVTIRVPSLALPEGDHSPRDSEAVRLFIDRAGSAQPGFEPDDEAMAQISRIVTRIDGIPLGLELAAARLRSMSIAELADRLEDSFRILSGSAKTALPRQQTLTATIAWSHELLKPGERSLFRRLAVFFGGFDLDAAEAVCAGGEVEGWEVIDLVDSLVDKSLVVAGTNTFGTRYRLLEPVRQFAMDRLEEEGEKPSIELAHARHYAAFVATASPHTRGPDQMAWERHLDVEYDNIRVGFETMLESREFDLYLTTGFDLFLYWMHLGMHVEGIETLLAGLEAAGEDADSLVRLKAWTVVAGLGAEITQESAIGHARTGLELAKEIGDPNAIGRAELQLGAAINHATTDPGYLEHLIEARRLLEANPEPHWWEPEWEEAFLNLVLAAYLPRTDERVREHVDVALAGFEKVGDDALLAATLGDSAGLLGLGDDEWVMANLFRAAEILSEIEVPYWYGHVLMVLGTILERTGEHEKAREYLSEAVVHLGDCGDVNCWASSSRGLASAEAALGDPKSAGYRIAEVIEKMPILPMPEIHKPRTLDAAAKILLAEGQPENAAVALGRATATEFPVETIFSRKESQQRVRDGVIAALGEEETARLEAEGEALEVDDTLAKVSGWLQG